MIYLWFMYCILLGRIYSCPEGKRTQGRHKRTQWAQEDFKVPHLTYPPICIQKTATAPGSPYSFSNSAWVLLRPTELSTFKELWDGTSSLLSLFEKTRKYDHLQMKLQRQHFSPQLLKDPECWSGRSLKLTTSHVTAQSTTKWATNARYICYNLCINLLAAGQLRIIQLAQAKQKSTL